MGFIGKVPINHQNMRTEMGWIHALDADHFPLSNFQNVSGYDMVIIIWPKGNAMVNAEGIEVQINKVDNLSKYVDLPVISTLKQNKNSTVAFMQEGPNWFFNDYSVVNQINYFNLLVDSDIIFVHNEIDKLFYEGLIPNKQVFVMRSLMYDNNPKQLAPSNKTIIGGNFCRWYGGFQSYIIASVFDNQIDVPSMHSKRTNEEKIENLNHLPYMNWVEWFSNLSQYKYAVHLMPTIAAGTFSMNCAYWGIPCIGNKDVDTQRLCYPELSIDINDLAKAKELAKLLISDPEFYARCSNTAKENYAKFYGERNFLENFYKNIEDYDANNIAMLSQNDSKNKIAATRLFKWNRFDLPIKSLFLSNVDKETAFGDDIYRSHLEAWNGFVEYDDPSKNEYSKFCDTFEQINSDMMHGNFNWDKSPVKLDGNMQLLNGAHRVAAAANNKIDVQYEIGQDIIDGQMNCDYKMFIKHGLDEKYMDAAALELTRKNKNLLIVSLFPSATHSRELIDTIIKQYGNIAYKKEVNLNSTGALNYMFQLYKGEAWAGDWQNNFSGFRDKARLCFTSELPMIAYLVELTDINNARQLKQEIRDLYKIGNHSVHINDTHEQTLRIARSIFNKSSIFYLNNAELIRYTSFQAQLEQFENTILQNNLNLEDYCIVGSSILSIFGLKQGHDLDYLHHSKELNCNLDIDCHNNYRPWYYPTTIDDIIYNPNYHFYVGNVKFATLDVMLEMKKFRSEPKDAPDIELILSKLEKK